MSATKSKSAKSMSSALQQIIKNVNVDKIADELNGTESKAEEETKSKANVATATNGKARTPSSALLDWKLTEREKKELELYKQQKEKEDSDADMKVGEEEDSDGVASGTDDDATDDDDDKQEKKKKKSSKSSSSSKKKASRSRSVSKEKAPSKSRKRKHEDTDNEEEEEEEETETKKKTTKKSSTRSKTASGASSKSRASVKDKDDVPSQRKLNRALFEGTALEVLSFMKKSVKFRKASEELGKKGNSLLFGLLGVPDPKARSTYKTDMVLHREQVMTIVDDVDIALYRLVKPELAKTLRVAIEEYLVKHKDEVDDAQSFFLNQCVKLLNNDVFFVVASDGVRVTVIEDSRSSTVLVADTFLYNVTNTNVKPVVNTTADTAVEEKGNAIAKKLHLYNADYQRSFFHRFEPSYVLFDSPAKDTLTNFMNYEAVDQKVSVYARIRVPVLRYAFGAETPIVRLDEHQDVLVTARVHPLAVNAENFPSKPINNKDKVRLSRFNAIFGSKKLWNVLRNAFTKSDVKEKNNDDNSVDMHELFGPWSTEEFEEEEEAKPVVKKAKKNAEEENAKPKFELKPKSDKTKKAPSLLSSPPPASKPTNNADSLEKEVMAVAAIMAAAAEAENESESKSAKRTESSAAEETVDVKAAAKTSTDVETSEKNGVAVTDVQADEELPATQVVREPEDVMIATAEEFKAIKEMIATSKGEEEEKEQQQFSKKEKEAEKKSSMPTATEKFKVILDEAKNCLLQNYKDIMEPASKSERVKNACKVVTLKFAEYVKSTFCTTDGDNCNDEDEKEEVAKLNKISLETWKMAIAMAIVNNKYSNEAFKELFAKVKQEEKENEDKSCDV